MTQTITGAQNITSIPEDSHWWFHSRTEALLALLDPLVEQPGLVLDVGGGAGNMVHHLSRYGCVLGIDNTWKPLLVSWERGYTSIPAEASHIPFANDTFSLIALLDVIEHVPEDNALFTEAYRTAAPGGLVAITTPAFSWLWSANDVANHHYRRYTRSQLSDKLLAVGFQPIRISYTYFLVFPAAAGMILLRRLAGSAPELATPEDEDAYQVEMEEAPALLNGILTKLGDVEASLLRRFDLPLGTALLAVARKPW